MSSVTNIKSSIHERTRGAVFTGRDADVKGNSNSIVISANKKYEAVSWDGF